MTGHAAVFDVLSHELFGFKETVDRGAFTKTIKEDDIRALVNHTPNLILGRNKAGTLKLEEDRDGLAFEIDVAKTHAGDDILESVERGDITDMSFQFRARDERWVHADAEGEPDTRHLIDVQLFDISPVAFPAYPSTDVTVADRSLAVWRDSQKGPSEAELRLRQRQVEIG